MNAPQQSGYILFIMIALLAGFGSLFLYSSLNSSGQSQKHQANIDNIKHINETLALIKKRLITFGNNADSLCTPGLTNTIALPTEALFRNEDFSVLSDQIKIISQINYTVNNGTATAVNCNPAGDVYNICDFTNDLVAQLTWPENQALGTPAITLDIKRSDPDFKICPPTTP